jgi:hypothetical protein
MTRNPIAATFTFAATLLVAGTAAAAPTNAEYYPFTDATIMKTTDKATAPAAVMKSTAETSTRKMGAPTGAAIPDQSREIQMYMKAGG